MSAPAEPEEVATVASAEALLDCAVVCVSMTEVAGEAAPAAALGALLCVPGSRSARLGAGAVSPEHAYAVASPKQQTAAGI